MSEIFLSNIKMTKASSEALKLSLRGACHRQLLRLATLGVPLCSLECLMRSRAGTPSS